MNFWKDGVSIDEGRTSVLVLCLVLTVVFACVMYALTGHVDGNFIMIINALILAVTGVNIAKGFSDATALKIKQPPTNVVDRRDGF